MGWCSARLCNDGWCSSGDRQRRGGIAQPAAFGPACSRGNGSGRSRRSPERVHWANVPAATTSPRRCGEPTSFSGILSRSCAELPQVNKAWRTHHQAGLVSGSALPRSSRLLPLDDGGRITAPRPAPGAYERLTVRVKSSHALQMPAIPTVPARNPPIRHLLAGPPPPLRAVRRRKPAAKSTRQTRALPQNHPIGGG